MFWCYESDLDIVKIIKIKVEIKIKKKKELKLHWNWKKNNIQEIKFMWNRYYF